MHLEQEIHEKSEFRSLEARNVCKTSGVIPRHSGVIPRHSGVIPRNLDLAALLVALQVLQTWLLWFSFMPAGNF